MALARCAPTSLSRLIASACSRTLPQKDTRSLQCSKTTSWPALAPRRRTAASPPPCALRELPPDADVLYLEACAEECGALRYSAHRPSLARASRPYCSAGLIFTARGARRVAALCTPVTAGFDDMMPELVARGWVAAYLALQGVLHQDCFWGSDANRPGDTGLQVPSQNLLMP